MKDQNNNNSEKNTESLTIAEAKKVIQCNSENYESLTLFIKGFKDSKIKKNDYYKNISSLVKEYEKENNITHEKDTPTIFDFFKKKDHELPDGYNLERYKYHMNILDNKSHIRGMVSDRGESLSKIQQITELYRKTNPDIDTGSFDSLYDKKDKIPQENTKGNSDGDQNGKLRSISGDFAPRNNPLGNSGRRPSNSVSLDDVRQQKEKERSR